MEKMNEPAEMAIPFIYLYAVMLFHIKYQPYRTMHQTNDDNTNNTKNTRHKIKKHKSTFF